MEKFYMTTAIAYTSGKPHIGNTYEIVLSDAIARFKRMKGYDVFFQTGTDEHGLKIEQKAKEVSVEPQEYVDEVASSIKNIWDLMGASYNQFVRTTDPHHVEMVQKIFKKLYAQGDIYKGTYEGWYCTPCESFFTDSQLVDSKCPDCGREVSKEKEEAYFFRMSKYQDRLLKYINEHPDFIQPESRKNEMINNFLKPGLQDLCVTRTTFKWSIPVTFDHKHVIYVWIDALTNYITFIGYDPDGSSDLFEKLWPADLHIIGKDILRFHTIYWPIILMALDLPLPKKIFGHPWLLTNNDKMSKSKGNVIYADSLVDLFGVDAVRYYLLKEIPYANDGNISYSLLIDVINNDLANTLGNLVQRTISMANKYFDSKVHNTKVYEDVDTKLIAKVNDLASKMEDAMNDLKIADSIEYVFDLLRSSNKYIDETMPWVLAKNATKKDRLECVLYNLLEAIRVSALSLEFAMPSASSKILEQLNNTSSLLSYLDDNNYEVLTPTPVFLRIDKEKFMTDNNL